MKKKQINIYVPSNWYDFLKKQADEMGLRMGEFIRQEIIVPYLREKGFFNEQKYRIEG